MQATLFNLYANVPFYVLAGGWKAEYAFRASAGQRAACGIVDIGFLFRI